MHFVIKFADVIVENDATVAEISPTLICCIALIGTLQSNRNLLCKNQTRVLKFVQSFFSAQESLKTEKSIRVVLEREKNQDVKGKDNKRVLWIKVSMSRDKKKEKMKKNVQLLIGNLIRLLS